MRSKLYDYLDEDSRRHADAENELYGNGTREDW